VIVNSFTESTQANWQKTQNKNSIASQEVDSGSNNQTLNQIHFQREQEI